MAPVKAIPNGFRTLTPLLNIKGAGEAIEFYKRAFGANELMREATPGGTIMVAQLTIGDSMLMVSEAVRNPATQASLHIYIDDPDTLWKRAVAAGAEVVLPIADQFWGDRYGILADRWGNRWAIAAHKEDLSPEEVRKRAAEAMKNM